MEKILIYYFVPTQNPWFCHLACNAWSIYYLASTEKFSIPERNREKRAKDQVSDILESVASQKPREESVSNKRKWFIV